MCPTVRTTRPDPALDKPAIEVERDLETSAVWHAFEPGSFIEEDLCGRVETRVRNVLDAVPEDVYQRGNGKCQEEDVEVE